MKAKIKSGKEHLFCEGYSNDWKNLKYEMIINFSEKYSYLSFKQEKNHLLIYVENGLVDIVFTGYIPMLEFDFYEKNQLVLKILNKQ